MKAKEARQIVDDLEFIENIMPKYYEEIKLAAQSKISIIDIGKPDQKVINQLRKDGYVITCEDDGDYHSSRIIRYFASW